MAHPLSAVHRTIVIVDVERFGNPRRTNPHQVAVRDGLYRVLEQAFLDAGLSWADCHREDRGDGIFLLAPAEVPKHSFVEWLPHKLLEALRAHNGGRPPEEQIRLRMALHAGEVLYDEHGVTGAAINLAFRLLAAPQLKTALEDSPGLLAIIVSAWFFDEVVRHSAAANATTYRQVWVSVKETAAVGWISLPDHPYPPKALPASSDRATIPVPKQLPARIPQFVGRTDELGELTATLEAAPSDDGGTVVISAINGSAGIGKTALAVHWAHQVAERFPDGQLYVNLRGYDPGQPMTAADALAGFLTALGVANPDIPLEVDERSARYRTEIAGRRLLILLDNASSVDQLRPLLPGTGSCTVVVTSRNKLTGLVALHGARRLNLDLFAPTDAQALLRRLIGARVDAEPEAAAALAGECARLPLALRLAAELAVSRPGVPLGELVAELADHQRRLDMLDAGGDPRAAVAAVFSWSVRNLPPDAVRTFRLLGLHPGPDTDPYATAALADIDVEAAGRTLELLARSHLVNSTGHGRFGMHDLLRAYAARLASAEDARDDARVARARLFDYYLGTAAAAMDRLYPAESYRRPAVSRPSTPAPDLSEPAAAHAWLDRERPCLVAVAAHTAAHGWPGHTALLSATLYRYLDGGFFTDALTIHTHARGAADRAGDRAGQAHALLGLGSVHWQLGRYEFAAEQFEQALTLFRQAEDRVGEIRALNNLGAVEQRLGRHGPAADHLERALTQSRQAADRVGEARALTNLGIAHTWLGRGELAADLLRGALALFRQAGDLAGESTALCNLGDAEERLGHYQPAAEHYEQAIALSREVGNQSGVAFPLTGLGTVRTRLGQPEQAAEYHLRALTLFREIGDRDGEAWALNGLGEAALAADRPGEAVLHHTAALSTANDTGALDQRARAHLGLGHAHRVLGESDQAREHYEHALTEYTDLGSPDAAVVRTYLAGLDAE